MGRFGRTFHATRCESSAPGHLGPRRTTPVGTAPVHSASKAASASKAEVIGLELIPPVGHPTVMIRGNQVNRPQVTECYPRRLPNEPKAGAAPQGPGGRTYFTGHHPGLGSAPVAIDRWVTPPPAVSGKGEPEEPTTSPIQELALPPLEYLGQPLLYTPPPVTRDQPPRPTPPASPAPSTTPISPGSTTVFSSPATRAASLSERAVRASVVRGA
jgi:hypothetical protein